MDIYVNDNRINFTPLFPLTWGNFFQKLLQETDFIPKDHGIVKILLDGIESLNVMVEKPDEMVPEDINEVKIFTNDSISITRDGLAKVSNLIESIKTEIANAADLYREENIKEASSKIGKVMEAFKPLVNFINSVGISYSMDFSQIMFNQNISLSEKIESFLETLSGLVAAQEKKDYVEVADYLEHHLLKDMSDWNTIANILLKEVEAGNAPSAQV
jgi:hypothetical protein